MVSLIFAALACYGMSVLVTQMDGPMGIFSSLRSAMGAYTYGSDGRPDSSAGRFISCPYCVSVWLAAGFTAVFFTPTVHVFADVFAVIGLTYLLLKATGH